MELGAAGAHDAGDHLDGDGEGQGLLQRAATAGLPGPWGVRGGGDMHCMAPGKGGECGAGEAGEGDFFGSGFEGVCW